MLLSCSDLFSILDVSPLSGTWFTNIFSHCLFHLLSFFLCCGEGFSFYGVLCVFLVLLVVGGGFFFFFGVLSRKSLPAPVL